MNTSRCGGASRPPLQKARSLTGRPSLTLVVLLVAAMCGLSREASALTCAQTLVTARGEPARFIVLARTKARANWRARVRAMPGLGAPYANWARALNAEERCISGPGGTACTLSATPCRP